MKTKHIISLGAGVQSSTMALMAKHGDITPMPEYAIFADTQSEPKSVYDWLNWLEGELPYPVIRVTAGSLFEMATTNRISKKGTEWNDNWPPLFAHRESGSSSPMLRQCTQKFKVKVIQRQLRRYKSDITQWIGISLDEAHRMKPSGQEWITNRYPLIDLRIKRHDCLNWMERKGYPKPPRSACVFCPYQKDREWLRLKTEEPNEFLRVVEFEKLMQPAAKGIGFQGEVRLHRSMKPIDEVNFNPNENQSDMFGNECYGMCGV